MFSPLIYLQLDASGAKQLNNASALVYTQVNINSAYAENGSIKSAKHKNCLLCQHVGQTSAKVVNHTQIAQHVYQV